MQVKLQVKLTIITIISIMFCFNAYSQDFETTVEFFDTESSANLIDLENGNIGGTQFPRKWSKNIISTPNEVITVLEQKIFTPYETIYFRYTGLSCDIWPSLKEGVRGQAYRSKAIYVFNQNLDENIGYYFLDCMYISPIIESYEITLNQIEALEINNSYFSTSLDLPPETTIKVYEKDHGEFIERYAFGKTKHFRMLMLISYHPKIIDNYAKPIVEKELIDLVNALYYTHEMEFYPNG